MGIGSNIATLGSLQQGKRMEVLSNNLSNALTPGYKKEGVTFSDFMDEATYTRMRQGPLRETGNPLDIALQGEGFLRVQTDAGERYTRAGNLRLNNDNVLVTQDGWQVQGRNGPITLNGSLIRIDEDGQISDDGDTPGQPAAVGNLDLVTFPEETRLVRDGNGFFRPEEEGAAPVPAQGCTVQQGALEGANFSTVEGMTHLIETMRIFEAHQKVKKTFGEMNDRLIQKMGME